MKIRKIEHQVTENMLVMVGSAKKLAILYVKFPGIACALCMGNPGGHVCFLAKLVQYVRRWAWLLDVVFAGFEAW